MKFVVGQGNDIKVYEIPDNARSITEEDEAVLAAKQAKREEEKRAYKALAEREEKRLEKERIIGQYKTNLNLTDYKAIKYAEGEVSEEEYASVKLERIQWRAEINRLEEEIKKL